MVLPSIYWSGRAYADDSAVQVKRRLTWAVQVGNVVPGGRP